MTIVADIVSFNYRVQTMSYLGSKAASGAYQAIIGLMPPHDVYIEAFLGSGAVMRNKPPALRSIGIDLSTAAIDGFNCVDQAELICTDAQAFIANFDYAGSGRVLIYADPPYLLSTRTSRARYKFEYSEADHIMLLELLRIVPAAVILSGYPSKLYDELLPDWKSFEFQAMTRGGVRTEKLWFNFEPAAKFWSSYAGKDFTDRQRIKRKAHRWAVAYNDLPPAEKLAVFAALIETHAVHGS